MDHELNISHPELRDGEVFIANEVDNESFDRIEWINKRKGVRAYDIRGNYCPNLFPVFIQRSELRAAGIARVSLTREVI